MKTVAIPENPYVALHKDQVRIHCGNSHHNIAVKNIDRIHISKRKSGYLKSLMGQLLRTREMDYDLNIETRDQGLVQIRINPMERFFCIQLVSLLRSRINRAH